MEVVGRLEVEIDFRMKVVASSSEKGSREACDSRCHVALVRSLNVIGSIKLHLEIPLHKKEDGR